MQAEIFKILDRGDYFSIALPLSESIPSFPGANIDPPEMSERLSVVGSDSMVQRIHRVSC